ncbi:MAG TPA: acetaldehyde dehydrogenase [Ktedonobacter sp.]|jgi:acyl-CoA reductase-like NAD-dependent aldehyde dehydrogenase|nr:acetaldehyde dehydrogenase [Ktedonobacter sp.]
MLATEYQHLDTPCFEENVDRSYAILVDALAKKEQAEFEQGLAQITSRIKSDTIEQASTLIADTADTFVDAMVESAVRAQKEIQDWPETRIDKLLQALAERVNEHAEELARAAVRETQLGNVADKTAKNRFASLDVYRSLVGQIGQGRLSLDKRRKVTTLASPVGVVFGLVPATNPTSTFIFKVLICLKGRNAIILSPSQRASGVSNGLGELIQQVLREHGAPPQLVQWVQSKNSRTTAIAFMEHPKISFILATGGPAMVKAAYRSGTPAIGVGAGNAPVLICADANLKHTAASVVMSKSFDNGIVCCSEHNLVAVQSCVQAFKEALEKQGAAVLSEEERVAFLNVVVDPARNRLKPQVNGQLASELARQAGICRVYPIKLIVVPSEKVSEKNPMAVEKLAPILSLFTVADEQVGMRVCQELLAIDGLGHTAIIHTYNSTLIEAFTVRMPVSRILVNAPGTQGGIGMTSGLIPSLTLGCGTFGGTSTTDNVTYSHLLNIKRVAYYTPPGTLTLVGRMRSFLKRKLLPFHG